MPSPAENRIKNAECRDCQLGVFCYDHVPLPTNTQQHQQSQPREQHAKRLDPVSAKKIADAGVMSGSNSPGNSIPTTNSSSVMKDTELVLPRILVNGKELSQATGDADAGRRGGGGSSREEQAALWSRR